MKEKTLWGIAVISLVLSGLSFLSSPTGAKVTSIFGANSGNMLAENYIPYVLYNAGYKSAKPIETTDDVVIGGGNLTVTTSNSATSTAEFGCLQMYATSTATAWKLQVVASSTQMAPGYNGLMLAKYGTCPSF